MQKITMAAIAASAALTSPGLVTVRAETKPAEPKAPASIPELATAFEAFKITHTEHLDEIKAGKTDVVTTEKLETINASLTELQTAVDEQSKITALAKLGDGAIIGDVKADPEYTAAFKQHMRKGDKVGADIQAAMDKGSAEDGGYLAPIEWDRSIGKKLKLISPMRAESRVVTTSLTGFSKLFGDRNVGSGWVGETANRPATSTPQISSLEFVTGELYANPAISKQLLDDAAVDLEQWLGDEVENEFARQEGIAFLAGNGTNKPHGLLTYVEGAANAARHPYGPIKVVNSGAASAFTGDGLIDAMYDLESEFAMNAKWHMNRLSMGSIRKLKDGQGNYLWQPSYASGSPQTLAGAPIVEHADMPLVGAGNIPALFGDMEATYLVVDRVGIQVLRDPYTNKPFIHFYTTKRVGGGVHNPEPMRAVKIGTGS
ncbi:MAG: phage major capsid protein [Pontixanthobacter sp.]